MDLISKKLHDSSKRLFNTNVNEFKIRKTSIG
nr:hypothetical protein TDPV-327 [Oriental turtle dovepox virus]